jgi:dolichyl-phosphate-mannose--protein O-mannosyl transferase
MKFLNFFKNKKVFLPLLFLFIFILNFGLRIINIAYPDNVVFDEAHFAQYSAAYGSGKAHIDIHPPLGKMILSIPLFFKPPTSFLNTKFVEYNFSNTTSAVSQTTRTAYGFFPYQSLRITSVFIGALLIAVIFLLVFFGTGMLMPALLATFFLTFENALLLETRLILIDGSMLLFGFLGLLFLFQKKKHFILAGIFIGLALAVKLTAIIFVLTGLFFLFKANGEKKEDLKNFLKFIFSVGIIFLFISMVVENIWISPQMHQNLFQETIAPAFIKGQTTTLSSTEKIIATHIPHSLQSLLQTWVMQSLFSVGSYTLTGSGPTLILSHWYVWPFMGGIFSYYAPLTPGSDLVLIGNPFVWGIGLTGLFIVFFRFAKNWIKRKKEEKEKKEGNFVNTLTFLCFTYLAIFVVLIHRGTFLYHYFPVFIASVCIFSVLFSKFLEQKSNRAKFWWCFSFCLITLVNFLIMSPFTYGFSIF